MVNIAATERPAIYPLCEYAVTLEFGNSIDEGTLRRVTAFNKLLLQKPFPGVYQTVPACASLTVVFTGSWVFRQSLQLSPPHYQRKYTAVGGYCARGYLHTGML